MKQWLPDCDIRTGVLFMSVKSCNFTNISPSGGSRGRQHTTKSVSGLSSCHKPWRRHCYMGHYCCHKWPWNNHYTPSNTIYLCMISLVPLGVHATMSVFLWSFVSLQWNKTAQKDTHRARSQMSPLNCWKMGVRGNLIEATKTILFFSLFSQFFKRTKIPDILIEYHVHFLTCYHQTTSRISCYGCPLSLC